MGLNWDLADAREFALFYSAAKSGPVINFPRERERERETPIWSARRKITGFSYLSEARLYLSLSRARALSLTFCAKDWFFLFGGAQKGLMVVSFVYVNTNRIFFELYLSENFLKYQQEKTCRVWLCVFQTPKEIFLVVYFRAKFSLKKLPCRVFTILEINSSQKNLPSGVF